MLTNYALFLLLPLLVTSIKESTIFDRNYASITVSKNYQTHRALPFTSPSIIANTNEPFRLTLQQTEYSNAFTVNPQTIIRGQQFDITISDTSVLNDADNIELQVEAQSTISTLRDNFTLDITVVDYHHEQLFETDAYVFEIPTRFQNAKIATIKLIEGVSAVNFNYTLYGSMANYFLLEPKLDNTIDLTSTECSMECSKLPREFALMIRAQNDNSKRPYDVPISIKLLNSDGQSRFKHSIIPLNMREKSLMDNPLLLEVDNPDNANLIFFLNDYEQIFEIDEKYGILSVRNSELLTVDNLGERFNISVSVSDGKNEADTSTVMVTLEPVIEQQTTAPKFSHKVYAFAANPGESFVGQVLAESLDGDVTYRISEGGATLFRINETDGEIFYEGPLDKDPHNYEMKVLAIDESSPPQIDVALVQILIAGLGSSPPKFEAKEPVLVVVNRTAGAGTVLHKFTAIDADPNAKVIYSINTLRAYDDLGNTFMTTSQFFEYFRFRKNGLNDGTLQLAKSFKNTTVMAIWLNVTASDMNHPDEPSDKVELLIEFIVPEEPISDEDLVKFDKIRSVIEIPEGIAVGSYIYTVNVKPLPADMNTNRRVVYSLSDGHRIFAINPTTGIITSVAKLRVGNDYNVTVVASDPTAQVSNSVSLIVRVIPSIKQLTPNFSIDFYTFNVTENAEPGTIVGMLSGPTDAAAVEYEIIGKEKAYFEIDRKGTMRTLISFDYEDQAVYHFIVNASLQNGPFTLLSVSVNILDENDVEPRFPMKSYSATVMENSPLNTFIINAQALDEDTSLEYSLMMNSDSSSLSSLLHVDKEGTIRNVEPLLGLEGKYQFAIIARDGRHTGASATIFLTILPTSKCQPTFPATVSDIIFVKENDIPGPTLAQFKAEVLSSECPMSYAIWDGTKYVNETDSFMIDSITGELKAKKPFDCEESDRHALVIAALSGDLFAQLDIEVRIVDENDNPIEVIDNDVQFSIRENETPGLLITRIRAIDQDKNDRIYFYLRNGNGKFTIDSTDGILRLANKLDREEMDFYELHIMVTNSENEPTDEKEKDEAAFATVRIIVLDVNDNGPKFQRNLYRKAIPREAVAGMKIIRVVAVDPDLVDASSIVYRHMDRVRQANGFVNVDEKSGILSLAQSPYDAAGGVFESQIASSDLSDNVSHTATTKLKVWVYDASHIVQVDIDENAKNLNVSGLESMTELLRELSECEVLLFNMRYVSSDGHLLRQVVRAQFLFINQTNDVLLPADRAISIIDRKALNSKLSVPKLIAVSHKAPSLKSTDVTPNTIFREAVILLAIFTFLLLSVLVVFAVILCYHRSKFLRQKKMYEDEMIAVGSLNKCNRFKQPAPYVKPVYHNLKEKYPNSVNENTYTVQEVNMLIGVNDTLKRVSYAH